MVFDFYFDGVTVKTGNCYLLSLGITKFEFEKENEMNSGSCSKMTPSRKWPIRVNSRGEGGGGCSPI